MNERKLSIDKETLKKLLHNLIDMAIDYLTPDLFLDITDKILDYFEEKLDKYPVIIKLCAVIRAAYQIPDDEEQPPTE